METKTFYSLICNHVIEIPIIQREYAQGRKSDRVTAIRNRFVKDLVNCVKTSEVMHLGFVYGKIKGKDKQRRKQINRDAVSSILQAVKVYADSLELKVDADIKEDKNLYEDQAQLKFIPLDGQQRLTTLYLLHWYLYLKGAESSHKAWLFQFNYTNRKSTMDFLKSINQFKNNEDIKGRITNGLDIKSVIEGSSFYLQKWNKDKTVQGMLEMLLAIENETNKEVDFDFSKIKLENLKFSFDFLDIDALNQTNELYVKMNSRGKHLTNYEHFKSWLQNEHDSGKEKSWFKDFWRNLDNKWLNFFWKKVDADFNRLDDFYFNFLKNIALMHTIASKPEIPLTRIKELINLIRNTTTYNSNNISYIPFEKFHIKYTVTNFDKDTDGSSEEENAHFLFNQENLKFIESTFDTLIDLETNPEKYDFLDQVLCSPFIDKNITDFYFNQNEFTPSQPDAVFFYSFIVLLNKYKKLDSKNNIREWLRIIRNLIYNTYIQNTKNFYDALQQIAYLISNSDDFVDKIIGGKIENSFFDSNQYKEEVLKIELKSHDNGWQEPITESENHNYFFGQINFILEFSKEEENNFDLNEFIKYSSSSAILFDDEIRNSDQKVLERSLLSIGEYMPYYKSNYLFCKGSAGGLRIRNENWRLFFKGDKVYILKELIDKLHGSPINKKTLNQLIRNRIKSSHYSNWDWRLLFLNNYDAISYCDEAFIRKYDKNDIRLLKGTMITGYHAELRTYCFYLQNKDSLEKLKPFNKNGILQDKNYDGHPGFYLSNFIYKEKEFRLDLRFSKSIDSNNYELCFYHFDSKEVRKIDKALIEVLDINDFTHEDTYNHYFRTIEYSKAENFLIKFCEEIKTELKLA